MTKNNLMRAGAIGVLGTIFMQGCSVNRGGEVTNYSEARRHNESIEQDLSSTREANRRSPDALGNKPSSAKDYLEYDFKFVELNNDQFYDFIGDGRRVVLFYADWAGPCKKVMPEFEKVAHEMSDVHFGRVNIGDCKDLASKFSIDAIPRTLFFEEGREIRAYDGFMSADLIYRRMGEAFK